MNLKFVQFSYEFPATTAPAWAEHVERWYQLDAAAYGLAELFWRERAVLGEKPAWILLASPAASNFTDAQFARTTPVSPAKFVHTLPGIRAAALLQLMNWSGPAVCMQKDPITVLTALGEAWALKATVQGSIWVASVLAGAKEHTAYIFILGEQGPMKIRKSKATSASPVTDSSWFEWTNRRERPRADFIAGDLEIADIRPLKEPDGTPDDRR